MVTREKLEVRLRRAYGLDQVEGRLSNYWQHHGGLLVITDFDGCLTKKDAAGRVTSIMDLVRDLLHKYDLENYEKLHELHLEQLRLRHDEQVSPAHKRESAEQAWKQTLRILRSSFAVTKDALREIAWRVQFNLRPQVAEWLTYLQRLGAQVVIYSASAVGATVIPEVLARHHVTVTDRLRIISNGFTFGSLGKIQFDDAIVTPLNKSGAVVCALIGLPPANCLILGDAPPDADVRAGLDPCEQITTIGFACQDESACFAQYYDFVEPTDPSPSDVFEI